MNQAWMMFGLMLLAGVLDAAGEVTSWKAASRLSGYLTVEYRTWIREPDGSPPEMLEQVEFTTVRFVMEADRGHYTEDLIWRAVEAQIIGAANHHQWMRGYGRSNGAGQYNAPAQQPGEFTFSMSPSENTWQTSSPQFLATPFEYVTEFSDGDRHTEKKNSVQSVVFEGKIPSKPGPIVGRYHDAGRVAGRDTRGYSKTGSIHLFPEFDDVEVEVTIEDYADWIPRGHLAGPQQAGNSLVARAVLKPKGDRKELPVRARSFRFELTDVTREPGVALNWPLNATDKEPDLQFAAPATDKLKTDVPPTKNAANHDEATARIAAHDFGAAGMLHVICALEDGRSVSGFLRHEGRPLAPIPIPNRRDNSLIAAKWRRDMKLTGSDATDDDAEPVGNGCAGDGFSHYEEYRGFVVGGQHIRTNPARKDFFVLNQIGRRAVPGLAQFATITRLTTHYELLRGELPESRRMNANRSAQSPRSTAEFQHAVILDAHPEGAASETVTAGSVGRPKTTERVSIHPVLFGPGRKPNEVESAIAHELLHSIGVKEHGDADRDVAWIREGSSVEERRAYWDATRQRWKPGASSGVPIQVFDAQGRAVAVESLNFDEEGVLYLYVGERGGKASGVVDCVMRYDNANVFTVPERPRDRFLSGEEPVGMGLCGQAEGTDFNAPGQPLVRYGNAQRGNCRHQFCVRDDALNP